MVTFDILGPLIVRVHDSVVPVTAPKVRVILAYLLLQNDKIVPVDELIDGLWGDAPPRRARNALQTYMMRLRQALGDAGDVVRTEPPGYLISVPDDAIDLSRFLSHVAQSKTAVAAGNLEHAAAHLRLGLELWRGRPLIDTPSETLQREQVPRLVEEHLQAIETRIDLDLQLLRHAELVTELRALTARHPLRERLWSQLILALYRASRQADALGAYNDLAATLRDELGTDPCEPVQRLRQQILTRDSALDPPAAKAVAAPAAVRADTPPPFQTPRDVPHFVGRKDLAERIRSLLIQSSADSEVAPGIVLSGLPGVGKTALAIHVAHRTQADFPDGQLYVDMRGYSQELAMTATSALSRFLRALGVAGENIPADEDEQSTMFRSLLDGRRILIVLDNVISADQVRPLLPGRSGSVVLATSRGTLGGLTAINGMCHIPIAPVTTDEGAAMLATILGTRVIDEPAASAELVALCGKLPLALRIAAANLAARPGQSVAAYTKELQSAGRVNALAIDGDDGAAVDASFGLSYRTLAPDVARMFRLLSLVPVPDFDTWAAANVAGVDPRTAGRMLAGLAAVNLVQRKQGRYYFHDLIREYAYGRSLVSDRDEASRSVRRLFDFYLYTADEARRLLYPELPRLAPGASSVATAKPAMNDISVATRWLSEELANLEAMVCSNAAREHALPVWLLADGMLGYLDDQRLDASWQATCSSAREAAASAGDTIGEATMCRALGRLSYLQTRYDLAEQLYIEARDAFRDAGDPLGEARVLIGLSGVAGSSSDYAKANGYLHSALASCRAVGNREVEAETLTNLGTSLILVGESGEGLAHLLSASTLGAQLNLAHIRVRAESAIAVNDLYCGAIDEAAARFHDILKACQEVGYRSKEAQTLRNLAETHLEQGRPAAAHQFAERALLLAERINANWNIIGAHVTLGQAAVALGEIEVAVRHFSHAYDARSRRVRFWYPFAMLGLARCRRMTGDAAAALELTSGALTDPRPRVYGQAHLEAAKAYLALGDVSSAEAHAQEAHEIARRSGYRLDLARARQVLRDTRLVRKDQLAAVDH